MKPPDFGWNTVPKFVKKFGQILTPNKIPLTLTHHKYEAEDNTTKYKDKLNSENLTLKRCVGQRGNNYVNDFKITFYRQ